MYLTNPSTTLIAASLFGSLVVVDVFSSDLSKTGYDRRRIRCLPLGACFIRCVGCQSRRTEPSVEPSDQAVNSIDKRT
jgi:hypothetical protein